MAEGQHVLVVGGGIGGMAAAIRLTEDAHRVELIDLDPEWRVHGAGITITGPTLRAYKRLGLLDEIKTHGAVTSGLHMFRYDGTPMGFMDEPALEDGLPSTGGIMRPVLHRIMQRRVQELGVPVRLGITVEALSQDRSGVDVTFSDGSSGRYDLVVGADGIGSKVRSIAFLDAKQPRETGQACWRISIEKPPAQEGEEFYFGHRHPVGITACGPNNVYLFMLTPHKPGDWLDNAEAHAQVRKELADFGGNVAWIRDNLTEQHFVNYRPLASVLQSLPWSNGRIVLIGDAAHATTPHLASGAGLAVEDALVLVEELAVPDRSVEDSLRAFGNRRFERCRDVVETSVGIGEAQLAGAPPQQLGAMMSQAMHRLAGEI